MASFDIPSNPHMEDERQRADWKWKTFSFQSGVLYLTSTARKLSFEQKRVVFDDVRSFAEEKPKKLHTGTDGTVYVLKSGSYLLKEQKTDGEELMTEYANWQNQIKNDPKFPDDVHLIDYLALVEPPYLPADTWGRKRQKEFFENYQTDVAIGAGFWTRKANICSYVVMPFVGNGISLGMLGRYNEQRDLGTAVDRTVKMMIEKGVISHADETENFADEQFKRIQSVLKHCSKDKSKIRDFAYRNIVIDVSREKPHFYLIDL